MNRLHHLTHTLILVLIVLLPGQGFAAGFELINFKENTKLPGFILPELVGGKAVTFEPASGKPSLLMFFSVDPPFKEQRSVNLAGVMSKLNNQFRGRLHCYAIFSDDRDRSTIKKMIEDQVLTIPVLDDAKKQVYDRYGVFMMPLAILLSGDGVLQAVVPYTFNIEDILANNLKFLLGDWSKEQWKESFQPLQNVVKSKEENEYIRRVNYGRVMLSRKMHSAALREFMTANKIMPKSIEAYVGLGEAQFALDKLDSAEKSFRQALQINKDSDEALAGLGLVLYKKGAVEQAVPILESALISVAPPLEVMVVLAEFYEQNGQIDKAIRLNKLAVSRLMDQFH
ncbi:MAG: redoxin domain-containing protein [Desulfobulbaceae bacterium]|nr:redoxin domain-containing protein [Desulfobulbaceae bacterium]